MKKGDRPLRFHIIVSGTGREHFRSHGTASYSLFFDSCQFSMKSVR